MIQGSDGTGFAIEAFVKLRSADFDCHNAIKASVAGAVDFTHSAGSDKCENLVRPELRPGGQRHIRRFYLTKARDECVPGFGGQWILLRLGCPQPGEGSNSGKADEVRTRLR
jgi:hypothetical protein